MPHLLLLLLLLELVAWSSASIVSYQCHNATDQPAAPNLRLLTNLSTATACEQLCTTDPHCVAYVVADCTLAGGWLNQCGGAKPCDVPKGRLDCWLKSGTTSFQGSGCRRICTNGRAPQPAPPPPPPAPIRHFVCTREGACEPGIGHVSYTDPSCFHQCTANGSSPEGGRPESRTEEAGQN